MLNFIAVILTIDLQEGAWEASYSLAKAFFGKLYTILESLQLLGTNFSLSQLISRTEKVV